MYFTNRTGMQKSLTAVLAFLFIVLLPVSSCKKKRAFNEEDAQDALDVRVLQGECDEIWRDANTVVLENPGLRSKEQDASAGSATTSICGASIDTSHLQQGIFVVNYTGADCFGRVRTGAIRCTVEGFPNVKWKHAGAVMKIEVLGYRVTRVSDGKGITLEGTMEITNESGYTIYELWFVNQPKLVQRMKASELRCTYDNGDFVKINMDRRISLMSSNFVLSSSVEGLGSQDNHSNIENWGQARKGQSFNTQVIDPYTWKTSCGSVAPVYGQAVFRQSDREHEITCDYAVDKDGNDMSWSDNPCPFGFKARWSFKKKSKSVVLSYY
jgi:hypothetical protein